jgi:hypothetical protein
VASDKNEKSASEKAKDEKPKTEVKPEHVAFGMAYLGAANGPKKNRR